MRLLRGQASQMAAFLYVYGGMYSLIGGMYLVKCRHFSPVSTERGGLFT